ncbi:hypothetical protein ACFWP3_09920 [Streptomyces sp. NPDC058525]|uniref:hypothetical protein n=1 Tax=Streptomyces sp. NPDC058525 TaxID=3346538 RepID=UPI003655BFE9
MRTTALKTRRWAATAAVCCALVAGCSSGGGTGGGAVGGAGEAPEPLKQEPKPLAVGELDPLLLSSTDLGYGYIQNPATAPEQQGGHDDVSIQGCAALEQLGKGDSDLNFASKVDVSFTYDTSTLGEELHSDRPSVLSSKLRKQFDAYLACPTYTMTSGTTPIEVQVSKSATPKLGDEQFAYATTLNLPSGPQIMKTLAVRKGNVAVILVGAPGLVDRHIDKAVSKLPAT